MNIYQTSQDTHMLTELLYSPLSLLKKKKHTKKDYYTLQINYSIHSNIFSYLIYMDHINLIQDLYKTLCIDACAVLCLVAQLCLTLYDPMNCSLPGSSVLGESPGKNAGVGVMPSSNRSS